ncbi:MAG: amidinotransferase [Sphingobacteriales bacterium]|nr:amidinotransferase [Sphingobacteriales bacterium]
MIRPAAFGFNAETAVNNAFQKASEDENVNSNALQEFDDLVSLLRQHDINVLVIDDTISPHTPDSIFPNNWVSYHGDGTVALYPMFANNRRKERNKGVLEKVAAGFTVASVIDFSNYETKGIFLEGTGSMVIDRENGIVYACLSPRTDKSVFEEFCRKFHYKPVSFTALDQYKKEIYHTNVIMCVADKFVVICLESIDNQQEKNMVRQTIQQTGKVIIEIGFDQMNHFAGNMLQVQNNSGEKFLVMSTQAFNSLTGEQIAKLESFNSILHAPLYTIEQNGGGSARCMMAEIFLSPKNKNA